MTVTFVLTCLALGTVLSLSCGLRAFLAPFAMSVAQGLGWVDLGETLHWMGNPLAIGVFGAAIVIEILADKVPAVDHAMDVLHTGLKPITGALAAMALMDGSDPLMAAVAALATGGVVAGGTHLTKATVRLGSSGTTAGAGNPVLSLIEDGLAIVLTAAGVLGVSQLG